MPPNDDDGVYDIYVMDSGSAGIYGYVSMDALYLHENNSEIPTANKEAYVLTAANGLTINIGAARPNFFTVRENGTHNVFQVKQNSFGGHCVFTPFASTANFGIGETI